MRLIDADVLKRHIDKLPALPDGNFAGNHSALKALINMQPTIEPSANCSEIPNGSDDTISRQAAIDALYDWSNHTITDAEAWHLRQVIGYIKSMPSAQPEPHWIPCSERLPENDNEVLITVWDAEDDYVEVYKGFYQEHEWWTQWCHGCSKIKDEPCGENIAIAWMPLPGPYKGGDE